MSSKRSSGWIALAVSALMAIGLAQPATAHHGGSHWGQGEDGHSLDLSDTQYNEIVEHGSNPGGTWTPPTEWPEYRYVPTCFANAPEGGADALCGAATMSCLPRDEHRIRYWVYRRTVFADGRTPTIWEQVATVCRGADDPMPTTPRVTVEMVTEVARAVAPRADVHIEPAARSYVNVPNNYYTDAPDVTRTVNLFGNQIAIVFKATGAQWSFGDGTSDDGVGIAAAEVGQHGAIEHAYRAQGTYSVTVSARYDVTFTLPGGAAQTVQLTSTPGDAGSLDVGEVQTRVTSTD